MDKETRHIEPGTPQPDPKYHIEILPRGPFLVYGSPPLQQEILEVNEEDIPWKYVKGKEYPMTGNPTALCRCGCSKSHPYCDGSHTTCEWDATLTADNRPLLEHAEFYDGPTVQLADNPDYCAHARICMAKGNTWQLTEESASPAAKETAIYESMYCPSGRLKIWDRRKKAFLEPPFQPSLGLIEDPQEKCSGPLWVKGGIPINGPNAIQYEQRNRITLCRCGSSLNKPFCDCSHSAVHFDDQLPISKQADEENNLKENHDK